MLRFSLVVLLGSCAALPKTPTPDSRLPVLSFRWKKELTNKGNEPAPTEHTWTSLRGTEQHGSYHLYLVNSDGAFYSLRASDGHGEHIQLGPGGAAPTIDGNRIYVPTSDGYVLLLDAEDMSERWRYDTRTPILRKVRVHGDKLLFTTGLGEIFAIDRYKGTLQWKQSVDNPEKRTLFGHAGVAISEDGIAYTGFADGSVAAYEVNSGAIVWQTSLAAGNQEFADVDATPIVMGNILLAASAAGGLFALERSSGKTIWNKKIENIRGLTTDGKFIYGTAAEQGVFAVDKNGNIQWRVATTGAGDVTEPYLSGEYLITTFSREGLAIFDKRTGRLYESFNPGQGISAPASILGNDLYVHSNRGILYAFSIRRFSDKI